MARADWMAVGCVTGVSTLIGRIDRDEAVLSLGLDLSNAGGAEGQFRVRDASGSGTGLTFKRVSPGAVEERLINGPFNKSASAPGSGSGRSGSGCSG